MKYKICRSCLGFEVLIFGLIFLFSCGFFDRSASEPRIEDFKPFQFIQDSPCDRDSDCILVDKSCCGCNDGGNSIAIHISEEDVYNKALRNYCSSREPMLCTKWYRCRDFRALCHNSRCTVESTNPITY